MDRHIGPARLQLGAEAERIYSEGLQLSFDEVISMAMRLR